MKQDSLKKWEDEGKSRIKNIGTIESVYHAVKKHFSIRLKVRGFQENQPPEKFRSIRWLRERTDGQEGSQYIFIRIYANI